MEWEAGKTEGLRLKNIDIASTCPDSKRTSRQTNNHRALMKLYFSKEVLEQCLQSFDIFRELLEDTVQKNKLIRDVTKNISLRVFNQQDTIYDKGDVSESLFLVLRGTVALCLPVLREVDPKDSAQLIEYEYRQIDSFQEGMGFGEAEFVHNRKRSLAAKSKQDGTVIGYIGVQAFEQIIELYRQRVYFKKMEMFSRCALLKPLKPHQLEFIINNAKPIHFAISKEIVLEGEMPKGLYLITQGQVELQRQNRPAGQHSKNRTRRREHEDRLKKNRQLVGTLEQGCFLGDCEIALNCAFTFSAVCKSEKVKAYVCNQKIIQSQVGLERLQDIRRNYQKIFESREEQLRVYNQAKRCVQDEMSCLHGVFLTESQQKIKRKILNRYVEKRPTIVGQLSPHEISLSIQRKEARVKAFSESQHLPDLTALPPIRSPTNKLKRQKRAFSPLYERHRNNHRKYSEPAETTDYQRSVTLKESFVLKEQAGDQLSKKSSEPLTLKLKRASRDKGSLQLRRRGQQKGMIMRNGVELGEQQLSAVEMRRLYEFISKLQRQVQGQGHLAC